MLMCSNKFDHEKIGEMLIFTIIRHDRPFQFIEYENITYLFTYICENTVNTNLVKLYKKRKK